MTDKTPPPTKKDTPTPGAVPREYGEPPPGPIGTKPGLSPNTYFNDAYNILPTQPKDTPTQPQDGKFDKRFNDLENQEIKFKGKAQAFSENGERGNLYIENGLVVGIEFTGGSRQGQKFAFDRDPKSGEITKMQAGIPAKEGQPAQKMVFDKTEKGWTSNPPGQNFPNFKHVNLADANIKVSNKGDISIESKDKMGKEVVRLNGEKDFYNLRDYSRERESLNGQKTTNYWDGYEWRAGTKTEVQPGVVKYDFPPAAGKPVSAIRNGATNGFEVSFGDKATRYSIADWKQGKIVRTNPQDAKGEQTSDVLLSRGTQNAKGNLEYGVGQVKTEKGMNIHAFNDPKEAEKVKSGEIPAGAVINPTTGEQMAIFANGTRVTADERGRPVRYTYNNGTFMDVVRDTNDQFTGFRHQDGTIITKGPDVSYGTPATPGSQWTIQRPGQQAVTINGVLNRENGGSFSISNQQEGVIVGPDGKLAVKQVVQPPPQPNDTKPKPPNPQTPAQTPERAPPPRAVVNPPLNPNPGPVSPFRPGQAQPPGRRLSPTPERQPLRPPPVRTDGQPGLQPGQPPPTDRTTPPTQPGRDVPPVQPNPTDRQPGKTTVTDQHVKALATKYKINPKILTNARERAEKTGQVEKFTPENLDKFLELAQKHNLLSGFTDRGFGVQSPPGALVGRLIPDLMADPDNAIENARKGMIESVTKSMTDAGTPEAGVKANLDRVETTFRNVKQNTQPFVADLKAAISAKPPVPTPTPTPTPSPVPKDK